MSDNANIGLEITILIVVVLILICLLFQMSVFYQQKKVFKDTMDVIKKYFSG